MGTPAFAVPTLDRIVAAGHTVGAVYTQPDRPRGRGQQVASLPVKEAAVRHGLRVEQPEKVKQPEVAEQLKALAPDAIVVVGYGQIIPQSIIDIPRLGIINVHASLLPKYRGAAPIQWAIANGDEVTGVTTMRINAGLDTGDMLMKWETSIGEEETAVTLGERLAVAGADLLVQTLSGLEAGTITPEKQDDKQATLAPILKKEDGLIEWTRPAPYILNRMRGFVPWPGTYSTFRGWGFHVWKAKESDEGGYPGILEKRGKQLFVGCGVGTSIELLEVQLEGRKRMDAQSFLNGNPISEPETLGEQPA